MSCFFNGKGSSSFRHSVFFPCSFLQSFQLFRCFTTNSNWINNNNHCTNKKYDLYWLRFKLMMSQIKKTYIWWQFKLFGFVQNVIYVVSPGIEGKKAGDEQLCFLVTKLNQTITINYSDTICLIESVLFYYCLINLHFNRHYSKFSSATTINPNKINPIHQSLLKQDGKIHYVQPLPTQQEIKLSFFWLMICFFSISLWFTTWWLLPLKVSMII